MTSKFFKALGGFWRFWSAFCSPLKHVYVLGVFESVCNEIRERATRTKSAYGRLEGKLLLAATKHKGTGHFPVDCNPISCRKTP